jgi:hypothetical protein
MAKKLEFTAADMKEAFQAGQRLHTSLGSWGWQRWMRNNFPERYVRKPKAVK